MATGGITQVIFACHKLLTLFGVVCDYFLNTFVKCLSDYFLITNRAVVYPVTTLLNMADSDLTFTGQSRYRDKMKAIYLSTLGSTRFYVILLAYHYVVGLHNNMIYNMNGTF